MTIGYGLISMKPSSVNFAGTSAKTNLSGGVDFSSVTSLSLNGVFTSSYENYLLVINHTINSGSQPIYLRLRASGTDDSGTNYAFQNLYADATSITGLRGTGQAQATIAHTDSTTWNGDQAYIYSPFLSSQTATRNLNVNSFSSARIVDSCCVHAVSSSYDGFTLIPNGASMSGNLHVFGYEE